MNTPSNREPASDADRRVAPRFQPAFATVYRYKKSDSDQPVVGLVWNISQTGVSMLLADPPERGWMVSGELQSETGGPGLAITLRVVHVRQVSTGDYLLGAQFDRKLEPEEIQSFLTPPPKEKLRVES